MTRTREFYAGRGDDDRGEAPYSPGTFRPRPFAYTGPPKPRYLWLTAFHVDFY